MSFSRMRRDVLCRKILLRQTLGIMGFAGGMATQFVLPIMGRIYDEEKLNAAGEVDAFAALQGSELAEVIRVASVQSFQFVAFIPVILVPIFILIWFFERRTSTSQNH
jgi:hypothetical protein